MVYWRNYFYTSRSKNKLNRSGGLFYFTKISIGYLVKAGGGTIRIYKDDVDTGVYVDTSVGNVGELKFLDFSHTQTTTKNKITYTVTGGSVEVVYQMYEDTRNSNFMIYPCNRGGLGISDAMSTPLARNNLSVLLNKIQPHLATLDCKETKETMAASIDYLLNIIDGSSNNIDVILCGSTPIANNPANTLDQIEQNKILRQKVIEKVALNKRYYYIDKMLPFSINGDVTTAYGFVMSLGNGVYGDGVHYSALGIEIANTALTRLFNNTALMFGASGKNVNAPVKPSKLAIDSIIYGEASSLRFGADTGGYHWFIEYLYSFYLRDQSGNKIFQIATGGGKSSVLPSGYKLGGDTDTRNITHNSDYYQFKDSNSNGAIAPGGFMKVQAGVFRASLTRAQILAIPANSNAGAFCFCSDATGGACLVYARGINTTDWVKVKDDSAI